MRIAVTYDAGARGGAPDVAGVLESVDAVIASLHRLGHEATPVPADRSVEPLLPQLTAADLVFNLVEGLDGVGGEEPRMAAAQERTGRPMTGARADALALARRKDRVNAILAANGLPVPPWTLATPEAVTAWASFPAIVKPAAEDASTGIDETSVVTTRWELQHAVAAAQAPAMIQTFVGGRELNVGIVGDAVLPVAEIVFSGSRRVVSYAAKWDPGSEADRHTRPLCPAPLDPARGAQVVDLARRAWAAVGGSGYGRVDLRADEHGEPWILEVNPNPDLAPTAGLARMADAAGWGYDGLIDRILAAASSPPRDAAGEAAPSPDRLDLRPLRPADRPALEALIRSVELFSEAEKDVAVEVLDGYLASPGRDYHALGAFGRERQLLGYACYGPTPCTVGTWDLYWIAVAGETRGRGVGTALMDEVERNVASHRARLLVIETSSRDDYAPTRAFYERRGYDAVARVPDFYAPGDDRVIFARHFDHA